METDSKMITRIISIMIVTMAVNGCSSSSSNVVGADASESVGGAPSDNIQTTNIQTMRLVNVQTAFSSGRTSTTTYDYDASGNLIGLSFDGGLFDITRHTYEINSGGQIINRDMSFDGIPALAPPDAYYYDSVGGLRRIDFTNDSGVAAIMLYKFDGSIATNFESRIFDSPVNANSVDENAGRFVQKIEYQYEEGRLSGELIDDDGDGVVDFQRDYSYNQNGTLSSALDTGTSPSSFTYTYEKGACNNNWGNSTHNYYCVVDNSL